MIRILHDRPLCRSSSGAACKFAETQIILCPRYSKMNSATISDSMPSHVISTVFQSWSTSYDDDDDSHLPDDEAFIASLLIDDGDDLSVLQDTDRDLKFAEPQGLSSPTCVREFENAWRAPKRLKQVSVDISALPLPNPVKRESWNRPVCTFLNFFGSRVVFDPAPKIEAAKMPPAAPRAFVPSCKPTLAPTPEILFPVCPCKLKHVIHGGANAVAPPILKLLSTTSICKPVASSVSVAPLTTMPSDTEDEKDDNGSQGDTDESDGAGELEGNDNEKSVDKETE